jgi:hypothetical protein
LFCFGAGVSDLLSLSHQVTQIIRTTNNVLNYSNSKFKASLGRYSHWATIEEDHLTGRLDVSAYKNFEFGIAG